MKKILFNIFIFSIILNCRAYAKTYDLSHIAKCKLVSEYSENTKVDQMDTITFGSYPQSDASGNTKEPIEWIVLDKQEDKALLMAKYVLDFKCYNDEKKYITWKDCTLRDWLNVTFYNTAFNSNEIGKINITYVLNNNKEGVSADGMTYDHIFLLSLDEAEKYFSSTSMNFNARRAAKGTYYAKNIHYKGLGLSYVNDNTDDSDEWSVNDDFWLRSIDMRGRYRSSIIVSAAKVGDRGHLSGLTVDYDLGVRPAMWVSY